MERAERAFAQMPLRDDLLEEAFETFRDTGELPDARRLAAAVLQRALEQRDDPEPEPLDFPAALRRLVEILNQIEDGTLPETRRDAIRRHLYNEALCGEDVVRIFARQALKALSFLDHDVTQPLYLDEEIGLPEFRTVGMHVLGWPERLARKPYVRRARRLFARYAELRERIGQQDPAALDPIRATIIDFYERGECRRTSYSAGSCWRTWN